MKSRKMRRAATVACAVALMLLAPAAQAAKFQIVNNDAAGVGFNDATPATPVGGNTGTTLGQQRLNAFQAAADIWGARLASAVTIRVDARFSALACDANSAVLGSAGATTFFRDFAGAPRAGTWYPIAEANSLAGSDLDTSLDDIAAEFNVNLGQSNCLSGSGWYYGLDGNPGALIDFVTVLVHELGHGLGFLTLMNLQTGAKALGFDDIYLLNLENHGASPSALSSMTDPQRAASVTATGNLHWTGPNVRAASSILTGGAVGDHVRMYAPAAVSGGSSVSHWDTVATPNQVMEPSYTVPLHTPQLERQAFRDMDWKVLPQRSDFSGDGATDIFWRSNTGADVIWNMSGASIRSATNLPTLPLNWTVIGTGDLNGDGKSDIIWRDTTNGNVVPWLMNGSTILASAQFGLPTSWVLMGVGDFNGDGKSDLLWRNASTGAVVIWQMNGVAIASSAGLSSTTAASAAIGDFNGDGKADIAWRNGANGGITIWLMNGLAISTSTLAATTGTSWLLAGAGDFNGNGKSDLLFRNSAGQIVMWLMNGATIASTSTVSTTGSSWSPALIGDANFDGNADIFLRNTSGAMAVWFMNGASIASVGAVANPGATWTLQGTNTY